MVYNDAAPTSDRDTVRLLISDVALDPLFTDGEIDRFLSLEGDDVRLAAATALLTIASNETLLLKMIETQGLKLDGPSVARALRENAKQLRADANADGGDGSFLVAANVDGQLIGEPMWGIH